MITIIGTGHVFRVEEQTSFIIRSIWPDAVLVELDAARLYTLRSPSSVSEGGGGGPWVYRHVAGYQRRMAEEYGGTPGGEMLAAVEAGKSVGAEIELIDDEASATLDRLWKQMSLGEKVRLLLSFLRDRRASSKDLESQLESYQGDEERYLESMREKFPTLVDVLIDSRDEAMAKRIRDASSRYEKVVAVVGDGHVEGISQRLSDLSPKVIRLRVLMDEERMGELRAELSSPEAMPEG